jgi:hypothetical protein
MYIFPGYSIILPTLYTKKSNVFVEDLSNIPSMLLFECLSKLLLHVKAYNHTPSC